MKNREVKEEEGGRGAVRGKREEKGICDFFF
jgi:hypothetical protein